jgi:hypothetical protein
MTQRVEDAEHMKTSQAEASTQLRTHRRIERPDDNTSLKRRCFILILIGVALLFTGCGGGPSDAEVMKIMGVIIASAALKSRRSKAPTEFDHFVKHRIRALVNETSSWDAPPGYNNLTIRISQEIDKIAAYVDAKVGKPDTPGKLGGATDPDTPPHTDLKDVAKIYVDDGQDAIKQRQDKFVIARRQRVQRIVWRALAIHDNLWNKPSSLVDFTWHEVALEELLDRRLRFVERMLYTDSAQGDRGVRWEITAAGGPWKDNMRTVLFEYPFLSIKDTSPGSFRSALTAAGLTPASLSANFNTAGPPRDEIRFKVHSGRIRPPASSNWKLPGDPDGYEWNMKLEGKTPTQIFDLFAPATSPVPAAFEDFWQRNWIFCDHMVSALKVDALRFGLRRRTKSDAEFNDAADDGVTLAPLIPNTGKPDPEELMDEGDDYFEGVAIIAADLQIGDLVVIWNNYFFRTIFATDFGLENSIITDMYGEDSRNTKLAGHGASEAIYADFVGGLVKDLGNIMSALRKFISKKVKDGDPGHTYLLDGVFIKTSRPFTVELMFWAPFGETSEAVEAGQELDVPGAWWIRVRLKEVKKNLEEALILFPKSVAVDTSIHIPPKMIEDADSDFRESVYIPLSMPKGVRGGWEAYFKRVRDGAPPPLETKLEDAKVDSQWAPGFNFAGPGTKIPVLRPKVRK